MMRSLICIRAISLPYSLPHPPRAFSSLNWIFSSFVTSNPYDMHPMHIHYSHLHIALPHIYGDIVLYVRSTSWLWQLRWPKPYWELLITFRAACLQPARMLDTKMTLDWKTILFQLQLLPYLMCLVHIPVPCERTFHIERGFVLRSNFVQLADALLRLREGLRARAWVSDVIPTGKHLRCTLHVRPSYTFSLIWHHSRQSCLPRRVLEW